MSLYSARGVSAQKQDVHAATESLDKGLYKKAFCSIYPDLMGGDEKWVNVMHADGAGTKSILAYLYWKETGDISVWRGIAQDAIVMNLDDMLCAGITDQFLFSSTIDRNKNLVPAEVLKMIIRGSQEFFEKMKEFGISISYMGGETADVGDLVRTIAVNGTMVARWPKSRLVTNEKISPGNVIVGLAGFGKARYEDAYNSGIGSNGLTSARHDMLAKGYAEKYPETFDPNMDEQVVYTGPFRLSDRQEVSYEDNLFPTNIGQLLLSPTRTFAPILKVLLEEHFDKINGLVHCSGGGQTKCLKYIPDHTRIIKNNLFDPPAIFRLIREASGADDREMYQVFNMGVRMEIFTNEKDAEEIIALARSFGVDAQVTGLVEEHENKHLEIRNSENIIIY